MIKREVFILTEVEFHTAYLIDMIKESQFDFVDIKYIVRNRKKVSNEKLTEVHHKLEGLKILTSDEISLLESAYGGLTSPELSLISRLGVPKFHALSGENTIEIDSFNSEQIKNKLEADKSVNNCAVIFLDCILDNWWIDHFDKRIVNAHSAILPHARGMNAIEQHCLTMTQPEELEEAAGATLHYIDNGIDTGSIIKTKKINSVWELTSIWDLKAESYVNAFTLINDYILCGNHFSFSDAMKQDSIGPIYSYKTFTNEVALSSNNQFIKLRDEALIVYG